MKDFDKSSIFTGIILLIVASIFSISLILQPLDFGLGGPGHNNLFFKLGNLLYSVYGFSSIFIPLFLIVSGLSCFVSSSKWTIRKTMILVTAIVPFFTCVVTENLCRSLIKMGDSEFTGVKVAVVAITGLMLVIIEFLGSGIIADKIAIKHRKLKKFDEKYFKDDDKHNAEEAEAVITSSDETIIDEDNMEEPVVEEFDFSEDDNVIDELDDTPIEETSIEEPLVDEADSSSRIDSNKSIFDNVITTKVVPLYPEENAEEISDDIGKIIEEEREEEEIQHGVEEVLEETMKEKEVIESSSDDSMMGVNSLISQEEFEALTNPIEGLDDKSEDEEENKFSWSSFESKPIIELEGETEKTDEDLDKSLEDIALVNNKNREEEGDLIVEETKEEPSKIKEEVKAEEEVEIKPEAELEPLDEDDDEETTETSDADDVEDTISEEETKAEDDNLEDVILEVPEFEEEDIELEEESEDESKIEDPTTTEEDDKEVEAEDDYGFNDINLDFSDVFKVDDKVKEKTENGVVKTEEETEEEDDEDSILDDLDSDFGDFGLGLMDDEEEEEESTVEEEKPVEKEESKPKYSTGFVDNPNFPRKIIIHDGTEEKEDNLSLEKKNTVESKYPNKIELQSIYDYDEEDDVILSYSTENSESEEDDIEDNYEEDVTLPLPEFDVEETVETEEKAPSTIEEEVKTVEVEDVIAEGETFAPRTRVKENVHYNGSDVFSEMEEDIRKDHEEKLAAQNEGVTDYYFQPKADSYKTVGPIEDVKPSKTSSEVLSAAVASNVINEKENEVVTPATTLSSIVPPTINRNIKRGPYKIPSDLLVAYKDDKYWIVDEDTKQDAANLKQTLSEFNIEADVIDIKKGPVVTMFEILPAPGVRLSKIVALQDNIALSLAAQSVRIVAPIPGKQAVGIEVPNKKRSVVGFRELIEMDTPEWDKMSVPVILGKDILGKSQIIDLVKTPHMLIAGATGSGKSVCVNSLILSILFKRSYKDVKLILVDPKVVELKLYNDIPHLLTPVITEPKKALRALQYCLCEMERRYALLDGMGVRDISNYNQKIKEQNICTEKLPYIVVIIDEFADLMATSGKELESIVARLTAMSRAVGIHLVLATQRPSVNVITGLIKANIPTRIAFMVASRTDSNIIIDSVGAEKLLGRGDMLYASAVDPAPIRIQGTFVSDQEVEDVVKAVKEYGEPDYLDDSIFDDDEDSKGTDLFGEPVSDDDPLYDQALEIVVQAGKASASYIQRRLKIGYNRAARLVEEMEDRGIVGPANGSKPREIIHIP